MPCCNTWRVFGADIIVYDLLAYAAPLAARQLGIPDIAYCAGLKLIAPKKFMGIYQSVYQKLAPQIHQFLNAKNLSAEFHHLELLSSTHQMVFIPKNFVRPNNAHPRGTLLLGSLPISERGDEVMQHSFEAAEGAIVLCFGSALDPADYLNITHAIIRAAKKCGRHLIIGSRKLPHRKAKTLTIAPYLPLQHLMKKASIFIHHGGANSFSEAFTLGIPQILIPLTTDQPIQGEFLRQSQAGITIDRFGVTETRIERAMQTLLKPHNPMHARIKQIQQAFAKGEGAKNAAQLIESVVGISDTKPNARSS